MIPSVKHPYVRGVDWCALRWMDIADADAPSLVYLRRLILVKTPWFGVYVHWIYTTDEGRHPHDHPMSFASLVLRGGYEEQITFPELPAVSYTEVRRPGSIHAMQRGVFHRITKLLRRPAVTLVLTWTRSDDWGYLRPDGVYKSSKRNDGRIRR